MKFFAFLLLIVLLCAALAAYLIYAPIGPAAGTSDDAATYVDIAPGTPGATLLPELGPESTDLVLSRWHGVGPMGGTDLDAVLRNLGVSTVVVVGVSLNIAIPNFVMDAVNAAYRVIVPSDAVAGIPTDYGAAVIANTLSLLATITTTDDLLRVWRQQAEGTL